MRLLNSNKYLLQKCVVLLDGVATEVISAVTGVSLFFSSYLAQEIRLRLKINIKKMMRICLTKCPICVFGKPYTYQNSGLFTRTGGFTRRLSDCIYVYLLIEIKKCSILIVN